MNWFIISFGLTMFALGDRLAQPELNVAWVIAWSISAIINFIGLILMGRKK